MNASIVLFAATNNLPADAAGVTKCMTVPRLKLKRELPFMGLRAWSTAFVVSILQIRPPEIIGGPA